jgi:SAM-dependent methyltransferase
MNTMRELNIPRAHSNSWYDQLCEIQEGYYYPWYSKVGGGNGEEAFLKLVRSHLTPESNVLEVGCGHGELALDLAPSCHHILAFDRVDNYVNLANKAKEARDISNVEFVRYDVADPSHDELALPADTDSIDLIICRRGPLHWIEDAGRVCKNGAFIIALNPMEEPIPAWSSKLPRQLHYENSGRHTGSGSIHHSVENRLHQAGLMLHSGWSFDVPEVFAEPIELYKMITWGLPLDEIPTFEDMEYKFDSIYKTFAEPDGIVLRHCRFLWQAQIHQ